MKFPRIFSPASAHPRCGGVFYGISDALHPPLGCPAAGSIMHKKIPPGLRGERCCVVLRLGGYHHGKPDLDLFVGGVIGEAGGDQADLAFIGQIDI